MTYHFTDQDYVITFSPFCSSCPSSGPISQVRKLKRNTSNSVAPVNMSKPARKTVRGAPSQVALEPRVAMGWKPKLTISNRLCNRLLLLRESREHLVFRFLYHAPELSDRPFAFGRNLESFLLATLNWDKVVFVKEGVARVPQALRQKSRCCHCPQANAPGVKKAGEEEHSRRTTLLLTFHAES